MKKVLLLGLMLGLCFQGNAFAQVNAAVGGIVADASGALIPGVEITATNVNTGVVQNRITNETGNFEFPSLQPGVYTLAAALPGFQAQTYNNVQLSQGGQVRLNFTLQVGSLSTAVDVVAEADTLLATTTASVGNVLPEREVRSLPMASRNVLDLVDMVPGLVGDCADRNCSFGGSRTNEINTTRDGLRTSDGRYDNGVYSAIFTSPDLVEEVRVSATSIDPAAGRGSAQVQMQTRAGTNEYHGALFYTNNNSSMNTQGWFQNLVGAEKTYQNRNQFGGRLGGPIMRNKAFFFVLIDQQRFLEKVNVTTTVLTPQARQGTFRFLTANAPGANGGEARRNGNAFSTTKSVDLAGNVLAADPLTGAPLFLNSFNVFSDVRDPNRTRVDPVWVASQYLPRMPLPNDWTVGDGLNTAGFRWLRRHEGSDSSVGTSPNTNRDHLTARLDYQVNANNKVTYTMSREDNWGVTGQTGLPDYPGGYFGDVRRYPDFYTASWTSTLSPTILNEFRFGLKRDVWEGTSGFDKGCCYRGNGEQEVVDTAQEARNSMPQVGGYFVYVAPGLSLGRYVNFGVASPRNSLSPFTQIADTLSFTEGRHSFQGGFELNLAATHQSNHGGQATTRPSATLGVGNTPIPGLNATNFRGLQSNDITSAENLLTTLSGSVSQINEQFFINSGDQADWSDYRETFLFKRDLHQNDWFAYFKDNWKVTNNLTLNIGIRYDKYGTPYDALGLGGRVKGGQAGLFSISGRDYSALWNPYATGGSLTETELVGKHSPNPDTLIFGNDWNNFAPSFGFSYSIPWAGRETVVRGGYGINYTGSDALGGYSGSIGNIPGGTLVVNYAPSTYLDLTGIGAAGIIPVPRGGTRPFAPVPVTNRTAGITGYADDRRTPYVQSFNLSIQRELTDDMTLNVAWVGNKGTKLWEGEQLNHTNIYENGILDAFDVTRRGGDAALFDRIFMGLNVPGAGVVNGTTLTGSRALRLYTQTNTFLANGDVGGFANFLNTTAALTDANGGLLRRVGLPENFISVNPQFGSVNLQGNSSNSTYHSMQTQLTKRYSRNFASEFSYTWSKAISYTSDRDPRNRQLSKGLTDSYRPHSFKAHGTWSLPFGPNQSLLSSAPSFVHRVVEGWEFSAIFSRDSGGPLGFSSNRQTVSSRASNTADLLGALPEDLGKVQVRNGFVEYFEGLSVQRAPLPNFGGDPTLPGRFTNQVVVNSQGNIVLQNPTPGVTGNTADNLSLLGPSRMGLDLALTKRVQVTEGTSFTLRLDAINALNKPQWGNPNTDLNSDSFGRITSATGTRTITINARIDF